MHLGARSILALTVMSFAAGALAADAQAGKASAQAKCVQCHQAGDWEGEDAASLESIIVDILAGKVSHRTRLELTHEEAANIAAYWGDER